MKIKIKNPRTLIKKLPGAFMLLASGAIFGGMTKITLSFATKATPLKANIGGGMMFVIMTLITYWAFKKESNDSSSR